MRVLKFGGSSVGSAERIGQVIRILQDVFHDHEAGLVIFSAYQGITDQLIATARLAENGGEHYLAAFQEIHDRHLAIAKELVSLHSLSNALAEIKFKLRELEDVLNGISLIREVSPKTMDFVMSFGERLSAYTISACLKDRGLDNFYLDTRRIIKTDRRFGRARVLFDITNRNILNYLQSNPGLHICTGFIASTEQDETTTLGRGGSDFTASIFGAAVDVSEIEIWTDVDGVLTADPRKVSAAFSIPELSYEEAMEMSHFGAKVIYPPTMQPALDKNIPLRIKNTLNPGFGGTLVSHQKQGWDYLISGISSIDNIALLTIQGSGMIGVVGIAERIFNALASNKINVIMITQASSEHSICLAILPEHKELAVAALNEELKYEIRDEIVSEIRVETDYSVIAVVGENMRRRRGLAARVFQALGDEGINISAIAQGSSELNISLVVARPDEARALRAIHQTFFGSVKKTLRLYLAGTGLIGSCLLEQLSRLGDQHDPPAHILLQGLCNSRKMLLNERGIDFPTAIASLESNGQPARLDQFLDSMLDNALPNTVFIDCSASPEIASTYARLLTAGVAVVCANKKANSAPYRDYAGLQRAANKAAFLYETNVGAGLPVIQTIRSLRHAGDEILRVEGVLSGTLSYLLNQYDGSLPFSRLVRQAREQGFTEPDPRDDLSGMDVARKALILCREIGGTPELSDLRPEALMNETAAGADTVEQFFTELAAYDDEFHQKWSQAVQAGGRLRYLAEMEADRIEIGLQVTGPEHPAFQLAGSDNIVIIHSRYYHSPLVIRGPGAGAEVTAAGVLTDILKLARVV